MPPAWPPKEAPPPNRLRPLRYVPLLLLLLAVAAVVRPFFVESYDMAPALQEGDLVLAFPMPTWAFGALKKGDLVALPSGSLGSRQVRRVIGVPGEVVEVAAGAVLVEGAPLRRQPLSRMDYKSEGKLLRFLTYRETSGDAIYDIAEQDAIVLSDRPGVHLGPDEYYLLADRRTGVRDSRDYGPQKGETLRRYYVARIPGYGLLFSGLK